MPISVKEKFAVKFQIYTKVTKVDELALVYDEIKLVFSFLKTFPENVIVKYEDKYLGYVDLDSPIELATRKSDILLVESELAVKISTLQLQMIHITQVQMEVFQGRYFLSPFSVKAFHL